MGVKEEWEPQLNIYRLLMHREGVDVDHLKIHAIYRDWSLRESQTKSDYPPTQIQTFNLPVWPLEKAEAWLADKVAKHQAMGKRVAAAKSQDDLLSGICTPEERWDRGNSYAVKHKGKGRAIRVLSTYDAAKLWRDKNRRPGEQLIIEERLGSPTRCLNYCNVKEWCPFGSRLNDE